MNDFLPKRLPDWVKDRSQEAVDTPAAVDRSMAPIPKTSGGDTPTYGYGSNVLGTREVHLTDYLRIVHKRRWTALSAFAIVVLSICVYTFTATPIYEARAQVLIEKENSNVVSFKEVIEQNQIADDYYQTQYKILQSRALARRTLDQLKLWDHPRFSSAGGKTGFWATL